MGLKPYHRVVVIFCIVFVLGLCSFPLSFAQPWDRSSDGGERTLIGYILFAPMNSHTTYLIDYTGTVIHTWPSSYNPGQMAYMLEDNDILRTIRKTYNAPGGAGGGVQKISSDGTIEWDFNYYTSDYLSHHDIEPLPNGNVLMIAWEYITRDEAIAAGRNPSFLQGNILMPDHIIEVEPTGASSGTIVWEWHVMDHLIQDFDPTKENYGVVEDHPELIDFNYGTSNKDWLHCNSIDYHEEFDQILVSCHNFNEIWVIDHSTTTAEAAGHTGGNSGKGGDLLYRWGNPRAYRAGTASDQKFFGQHDSGWIEPGHPGEGNILVFNNGNGRPGVDYSSVDEIVPPVDEYGTYYLEPGSAYGPEEQIWIYTDDVPSSFFAFFISGAYRLPSGNTLICDGPAGRFFEVTPEMVTVWEFTNPFPNIYNNNVFKIQYIPVDEPPNEPDLDCEGSLNWIDVECGHLVEGSFQVQNIGATDSLLDWDIVSYPAWGTWTLTPTSGDDLTPGDGSVTIEVFVVAPDQENTDFEGQIKLENRDDPDDFDVIPVSLKTPKNNKVNSNLLEYLQNIIMSSQWSM
jgi:hypothetical protein